MSTPCDARWTCLDNEPINLDHPVAWYRARNLTLANVADAGSGDCPKESPGESISLTVGSGPGSLVIDAAGGLEFCIETRSGQRGIFASGTDYVFLSKSQFPENLNLVWVRSYDFSAATGLTMPNAELYKSLDLRGFDQITQLELGGNFLSRVLLPQSNTLTEIGLPNNRLRGSLILPPETFILDVQNNPDLSELVFAPGPSAALAIAANNCSLNAIDLSGRPDLANRDSFSFSFQDNSMTGDQVQAVLDQLDGTATAGYTGRVLRIGGNNQAPTSNASYFSLQGKGFSFI